MNVVLLEDYHCETDFKWYPFDRVECKLYVVSDRKSSEMVFELSNMIPLSHKELRVHTPLHAAGWTVTEEQKSTFVLSKISCTM